MARTGLSPPDDAALSCGYVVTNWLPAHPHWPPACQASNILWVNGTRLIPDASGHLRLVDDVGFRIKDIILQIRSISQSSLCFFCTESIQYYSENSIILRKQLLSCMLRACITYTTIFFYNTWIIVSTLQAHCKQHWLCSYLDSNCLLFLFVCFTANMRCNIVSGLK